MNVARTNPPKITGVGEFSPPTRESVERLRRKAETSGDPGDQASYQRAADALAATNEESEK